jgi:acylphosphatase
MSDEAAAAWFRVEGRVQGVGFRAATCRRARQLGLAGQALNRADGSVEVVAEGPAEALAALEAWLREGPPLARVERLQRLPAEAAARQGFTTG